MIFKVSSNKATEPTWRVETDFLSEESLLSFDQLLELQKVVNQLVSDEQSRLLQESLSGGFDDCDGCKI